MVSLLQREELEDTTIHCLSFNYFGTKLALCSADGNIQVWSLDGNKWKVKNKWQSGHSGAILKVRWAHPSCGSILATCSFDKTVILYEEHSLDGSWKKFFQILVGSEPVEDIQFAPKRLQIAVCSSNGEIKIYDPASLVNLKPWDCTHTFLASPFGSNVMAWNPSDQGMLLIGNNDENKARLKFNRSLEGPAETVQLWGQTEDGKMWEKIFVPESGHEKSVTDISWSQLMGRSKHLVVTGDLDGLIIIWRIDLRGVMEIENSIKNTGRVYNVSWDLMGTTLSCVGEDGCLKIYKKNIEGRWQVIQELRN